MSEPRIDKLVDAVRKGQIVAEAGI